MFDPRLMAPDGSSYSRTNALAGMTPATNLAATSGMTPPGAQTLAGPMGANGGPGNPGGGGSHFQRPNRTSFGFQDQPWYQQWVAAHPDYQPGMMAGFDQRQNGPSPYGFGSDFRTQVQDWKAARPQLQGGGPRPDGWQSALQSWADQRSTRMPTFPNFPGI